MQINELLSMLLVIGIGLFAGRYIYLCCQDEQNGKK